MWYIQWTKSHLEKGRNYLERVKPADWGSLIKAKSFDTESDALDYIKNVYHWNGVAVPTFVHPLNFHSRCDRGDV